MKKPKKKQESKLPKGAYRLPNGNYVVRRGSVTSVRRDPPDMAKLARAFLALAEQLSREEAEATTDHNH